MHTTRDGTFDELIEYCDHSLGAFDRESFLSEKIFVKKLFKLLCGDQLPKQSLPHLYRYRLWRSFEYRAKPNFLFLTLNVSVLYTDRSTIRPME